MSNRDTFERNIKSLTKTRTLKQAMKGWTVTRPIEWPAKAQMTNRELCGTRFKIGVLVHRGGARGKTINDRQ